MDSNMTFKSAGELSEKPEYHMQLAPFSLLDDSGFK